MVEGKGFEPLDHKFITIDGLANRCLQPAQPTFLNLVEDVRFELTARFRERRFSRPVQ